jgi:hypothetical protein
VPQAIPGCIAPHAWLDDGSSLYDRFGAGFTLLATVVGMEAELRRATNAAREAGLPLTVLELAGIGLERSYGADLALIRPDQHIAWRGNAVPADLLGKVAGFPLRS